MKTRGFPRAESWPAGICVKKIRLRRAAFVAVIELCNPTNASTMETTVRTRFRNASPEAYLAVAVIISIAIAAVLAQIPALAFGGFVPMALILIAADIVLYVLMKLGIVKSSRNNQPT